MVAGERNFESTKVGTRLREERERRGISLRELARRVSGDVTTPSSGDDGSTRGAGCTVSPKTPLIVMPSSVTSA